MDPNTQDSSTSDVFSPDYRPGKNGKLMARAKARARRDGTPLEDAIQREIEGARVKSLLNMARQGEEAREAAELREKKKGVFPEPNSVRAIPTGFETKRSRH